MKHLQLKLCCE